MANNRTGGEIRSCTLHMNDIDYIRYCCYLFRNELRGLCKKDLCDVQAPWRSKLWCLPNDVIPLGYLYQILEVLNYSWQLID